LFSNLRLNIFIYYVVTVTTFLGFAYYFFSVLHVENIFFLAIVFFCFVLLSGVFISKLAIDPLVEYVTNLQNLSKETLHELNLPVSTIQVNTQMLCKSLDNEKSLKRLKRINNACSMLQERYNELDYLIKMQSREDVNERFFLDALVRERVEFLEKIYPYITFELLLEPLEVFSDKKGLAKVIDNIVDNGVKYSDNSKVIEISMSQHSLFIQDFGIGMDEVELLKIFDNYYQSNSNMRGFGIGLSMVKRFCDNNKIELIFKSQPDYGTRVELKFKRLV